MECLYVNQKVYLACDFNCTVETEILLKVTHSHVHVKSGDVSKWCKIWTLLVLLQTTNKK